LKSYGTNNLLKKTAETICPAAQATLKTSYKKKRKRWIADNTVVLRKDKWNSLEEDNKITSKMNTKYRKVSYSRKR